MLRLLPSLLQGVSSLEGIKLLKVSRAYVTCACACTCACECRARGLRKPLGDQSSLLALGADPNLQQWCRGLILF